MADIKAVAEELVAMTSDAVSKMNKELKEQYGIYSYGMPTVNMMNFSTEHKLFRPGKTHCKTEAQRKNEISKRRKKNKNKKTHRK